MNQELLAELTRLSEKYPELRLCQLIANAIPPQEYARRGKEIYYIEDSQLLDWLLTYKARARFASALLKDMTEPTP